MLSSHLSGVLLFRQCAAGRVGSVGLEPDRPVKQTGREARHRSATCNCCAALLERRWSILTRMAQGAARQLMLGPLSEPELAVAWATGGVRWGYS